jgi:hypothetical protein
MRTEMAAFDPAGTDGRSMMGDWPTPSRAGEPSVGGAFARSLHVVRTNALARKDGAGRTPL